LRILLPLVLEPFGTPLGVLTLGAGVAHLGDIGLGELLQRVAGDEPSVGDFYSREFPVLAKLGHGDVRGPQELSRFPRRYELVFHR
jgi:hypothetical protein